MTNVTDYDKRRVAFLDCAVPIMRFAQDYALDLSISLRAGKETNWDSVSRGD